MFASPAVDNIADTRNLWPINRFFFAHKSTSLMTVFKIGIAAYLYKFVKILRVSR